MEMSSLRRQAHLPDRASSTVSGDIYLGMTLTALRRAPKKSRTRCAIPGTLAMQLRSTLIAVSILGLLCSTADAKEWNIGCANLACLAVDNVGNIVYLGSNGSIVGNGKLPVASPDFYDKPVGPIRIACSAATVGGNSEDRCEIVDGRGRIWVGPPRPSATDPIRLVSGSLPSGY